MMQIESIGKTNGNLEIPLIKISNGPSTQERPVIFIMGRQHPGETHSSYIIHGLVNFLLSPYPMVQQLREQFEIWIVPIANPDGVVLGNYRCNMQGKDMNRCFQFQQDDEYGNGAYSNVKEVECIQSYLHERMMDVQKPAAATVQMKTGNSSIATTGGAGRIRMFLDIHTHSSQRGIFIYAPCAQIQESIKIRTFPQVMDDVSQFFRLASCKYQSEKGKRNCARLAFLRDYKAEQ